MTASALILTDGLLAEIACKTAHGLIFGSSRYAIVGLIDSKYAGMDPGMVFSNKKTDIAIFASIKEALEQIPKKPDYCVIGVAPMGGKLSGSLEATIKEAIKAGISIVSGLHNLLCDNPVLVALAKEHGVELIDIRKPKTYGELSTWTGAISSITTPRIAVIGTDCSVGKRTTSGLLLDLCRSHNIRAEMIYTGQTGWLQNMNYGFILDATLNDFVAGEFEKAIIKCDEEAKPDLMILEGQSGLRNPAGPCGAEYLCSAGAHYVILQHAPSRTHYLFDSAKQHKIPDLRDEIALIAYYGAKVIAITLNASGLSQEEAHAIKIQLQEQTKLPVLYPKEEGLEALLPVVTEILHEHS